MRLSRHDRALLWSPDQAVRTGVVVVRDPNDNGQSSHARRLVYELTSAGSSTFDGFIGEVFLPSTVVVAVLEVDAIGQSRRIVAVEALNPGHDHDDTGHGGEDREDAKQSTAKRRISRDGDHLSHALLMADASARLGP
jgi:hypothetical protein